MSLYLVEMKIKTALEELWEAEHRLQFPKGIGLAADNLRRVRGILKEIIDRPKETNNG